MIEVQALSVVEADYKWPDDELVVRKSDYDSLEAERAEQWRLRREAEADRDTAKAVAAELRAELAALKGGQVVVAMIRYARGVPGFENEMPHVVSCNDLPDGLYPVYLAPPAQASAWPEWMASAHTFADRLYLAGWRDHADAQHSGAAGMYDQLVAPAPAPAPGASDGLG